MSNAAARIATSPSLTYRTWLDGLRGVSIILVMMVHLPLIEPAVWFLCPGGKLGYMSVILSSSSLRWLGRRSYGLYLWHWPMYELARLIPLRSLVAPSAIVVSISIAALSYRYIEEPFLRIKDRQIRPLNSLGYPTVIS
jgi:peptidoglycan/LPS O-acetylase OafA/YrhL